MKSCAMKLKMCKQWIDDQLHSVTLILHQDKISCQEHNHTAEYVDVIKLNSAVKTIAGDEVFKGYASASVNRLLKDKIGAWLKKVAAV